MKRIFFSIMLVAVALAAVGCGSFGGGKSAALLELDPKDWCGNTSLPVHINAAWVYRVTTEKVKNKEVTYTITKAETSARGVDFWVEETSDDEWAFYNAIMMGEQNIFCNADHHIYFLHGSGQSLFLANPVQRMMGGQTPLGFMGKYEDIEVVNVPAGKLTAARVCSYYKDDENDRVDCIWFAPDIGIVKREWKNGSKIEVKAELLRTNVKEDLNK